MRRALPFLLVVVAASLARCTCQPPSESGFDAGDRPNVGLNCGDPASQGNGLGIGKYCTSTDECPVASTGTTMQCSTVLTDDALPLLCSRLCGEASDAGEIDCGEGAVCHNIQELGYDLFVCVPYACESLFDGGLP